jgi:hypothetical protein
MLNRQRPLTYCFPSASPRLFLRWVREETAQAVAQKRNPLFHGVFPGFGVNWAVCEIQRHRNCQCCQFSLLLGRIYFGVSRSPLGWFVSVFQISPDHKRGRVHAESSFGDAFPPFA